MPLFVFGVGIAEPPAAFRAMHVPQDNRTAARFSSSIIGHGHIGQRHRHHRRRYQHQTLPGALAALAELLDQPLVLALKARLLILLWQ